ncbi:MAG: prepilin-type N-terminal cleavage/methylation domain-containing protein [Elusimicrobia bacterium]|nr:prepilin-type N-terminal cleavage/methylation domain-containing protein [Elusimicrobiota bacterium]
MKATRSRFGAPGFTLIELMIVVSIIGILAAIAIPKFADLIRKSREGKSKGGLGAIRSALTIYYSDMEGTFPSDDLSSLTIAGKYIAAIPKVTAPDYHPETSAVYNNATDGCNMLYTNDRGGWAYWSDDGTMCGAVGPFGTQRERTQGELWVGCVHTDMRGSFWTEY